VNALRGLRRLPARDVALLLDAAVLVAVARLTLACLPLRRVLRLASGAARRVPRSRARASRERASWAVQAVARRIPGAACLAQALAGHVLLMRHGHPCRVCIGVRRDGTRPLEAHAWVEDDGSVLIGAGGIEGFARVRLEALPR
jgi:Transglutaminase-like superfamily